MDEAEAFQRATRRKRRTRLLLLAALFAAPFAYLGWRIFATNAAIEEKRAAYRKSLELSEAERTSLRDAIAQARARLAAARDGWPRAVAPDALAAVTPSGAPCPIRLAGPTTEAGESYIRHGSIDTNYFGNVSYARPAAGAPPPPTAIDGALARLDELAAGLAAGEADRNDLSAVSDLEGRALFLIVDQATAPAVSPSATGIASFTPGRVAGRAYVYSYNELRVTCAGPVDVQSPETIEFDFSYMAGNVLDHEMKMRGAALGILERDLEVRVRQAIPRSLRAVSAR